jgi:hypothetical protein
MRGSEENRDAAAQLDALWDATRPVEPTTQDWDRVWTSVSGDLDRSQDVIAPRSASVFGRRPLAVAAAATTIALAQAAAILLAFSLSWPTTETSAPSQVATAKVRIEEGRFMLIRSNADAVQAIDLTAHLGSGGIDAWYVAYNLLEAMTNPVVAMSE